MDVALRLVYRVPVAGWLLRDAVRGAPDAKYYFIANVVLFIAALVYLFGYEVLSAVSLLAAATMLTAIVVLTAADLFQPAKRPPAATPEQARRKS